MHFSTQKKPIFLLFCSFFWNDRKISLLAFRKWKEFLFEQKRFFYSSVWFVWLVNRRGMLSVIFSMVLWAVESEGFRVDWKISKKCIRIMWTFVAQRKWTRLKTMRPRVRIPVKNFELWKCVFQLEKQFSIVFIALRGPEPAPTPSSDICERHMLVTWYQNGWRSNHNVGLRMLLVVGAGGGTSQVSKGCQRLINRVSSRETYNSWNSHKWFKRYKTCKE